MFSDRFRCLEEAVQSCVYTDSSQKSMDEKGALKTGYALLENCQKQGGVVYVIGNGGSAGIASHFSTDLIKSMKIPSLTLYDSNLMTCLGNDYGYDQVFSYPLEKLLKPQDLLIAISSSGKSPNIINAATIALSKSVSLISFSGFSESNPLRKLGVLNFWVNRKDYGLVETAHFFLLHTIVDLWNTRHLTDTTHAENSTGDTLQNQIPERNHANSR